MRKSFVIIFTFICIFHTLASAQIDRELYVRKVAGYTKMRNTGLTLAAAGGVATVAGIALVASADWYTEYTPTGTQTTTDDVSGFAGVLMIVAGIPMTVTGGILGGIGGRKRRQYLQKLKGVSIGMSHSGAGTRVQLAYRF